MLGVVVKMQTLWARARVKVREEHGASAVEYSLLVALIAAVIILAVGVLGSKVSNAFQSATVGWP